LLVVLINDARSHERQINQGNRHLSWNPNQS